MSIQLGKYQHYKGLICEVIGIAKHSETLEDMVVYKHYDAVKGQKEMTLRTRPLKMFTEEVTIDGKQVPRFKYLGE